MLQCLLQHWLELEQCIPVATHSRPAGTPFAIPFSLTAPFVICIESLADSARAMVRGAATRTSNVTKAKTFLSDRALICSACTAYRQLDVPSAASLPYNPTSSHTLQAGSCGRALRRKEPKKVYRYGSFHDNAAESWGSSSVHVVSVS